MHEQNSSSVARRSFLSRFCVGLAAFGAAGGSGVATASQSLEPVNAARWHQMATRRISGAIVAASGGAADAIYNELVAKLVGNSHMVAAGILAVNRAQERGYVFANVGV